ncbi:MAG: hypothetical protein Q9168_002840 [Polycauliona sp. 1 TL-2023]
MSTLPTLQLGSPPPSPAPQDQQHEEEQSAHQPEAITEQTPQPAMILVEDYTNMVAKTLAMIKLPAIESLNSRSAHGRKSTIVMLIKIGVKGVPPSYCLMKLELIGVLAKWMYSDVAIGRTKVQLEMFSKALKDPSLQKRAIAAFGELRGMQNVEVRGFNPERVGTALERKMKSPMQTMKQAFQRINAFRFRIFFEMESWKYRCSGNMEVYKLLTSTIKAAIRCMDQYHVEFRKARDWDGDRFIDRKIYLVTEQLYTKFVCCGPETRNLTHASKCMLQLKEDGASGAALGMLCMRLCQLEMLRNDQKRAAKYMAELEKLQPADKDVQKLKRKVERMPGQIVFA